MEISNPAVRLRQRLKDGKTALGAVVTLNSAEVAAHLATLGFDFLWIEMEHAPITRDGLRTMILATRGLDITPMARPPVNELWTAKVLLDHGALGVIFPFTRTAKLAQQAVDACRYPPVGRRGSGALLAQMRWPPAADYYDFADENIFVVAVVEDVTGLENAEEIAATRGLDVLFIGTGDLSFSLGLRGNQNHPKLAEAVERIAAAGRKHGRILGRPAGSPEAVQEFTSQGFQFFMTGADVEFIAAGAAQLLKPLGRKPLDAGLTAV